MGVVAPPVAGSPHRGTLYPSPRTGNDNRSAGEPEDLPERSVRPRAARPGEPVPREPADGPLPERQRDEVDLEDAHLPSTGTRPDPRVRGRGSGAAPPPAAEDEELGHVGHVGIVGELRSTVDEGESRRPAVRADQERNPSRVSPVRRELGEAEAAVLSDLARHELAEVVHVELEEIRAE